MTSLRALGVLAVVCTAAATAACPSSPGTLIIDGGSVFNPTPSDGGGRGDGDGDLDAGCTATCEGRECGDDGCGGSCGICTQGTCLEGTCGRNPPVVFVFDQNLDVLFRLEDKNADGDAMDPDEVTVFFDDTHPTLGTGNSQGVLAVGRHAVIATDNFAPANVVRLEDHDEDGDALDDGEATEFYNGVTPAGGQLVLPTSLSRGPDAALYLYDNNTLDPEAGPEGVYRLADDDGDGQIAAGEVTLYFTLSPTGVTDHAGFDVDLDTFGRGYTIDTDDDDGIDRVLQLGLDGAARVWLDGASFYQLTQDSEALVLSTGTPKVQMYPGTDELVTLVGSFPDTGKHLVGVVDGDLSGGIDSAAEIRVLWDEAESDAPPLGTFSDFFILPEGDIVASEALNDRVVWLVDENDDGDYHDPGETVLLYDRATVEAAGEGTLVMEQPRFIGAAR